MEQSGIKFTCLKQRFDSRHAVSTVNLMLKMLHSFAPYPLRPPVNTTHDYTFQSSQVHSYESMHFQLDLTCDLLLIIIIVTGGQELAKDQSRNIDLFHLVLNHRNTLSVVPHTNGVILPAHTNMHDLDVFLIYNGEQSECGKYLRVNVNLDAVHSFVPLFVISSIHYESKNEYYTQEAVLRAHHAYIRSKRVVFQMFDLHLTIFHDLYVCALIDVYVNSLH